MHNSSHAASTAQPRRVNARQCRAGRATRLWSADWPRLKFRFDVAAHCGIVLWEPDIRSHTVLTQ
jgi:hypothetical protein